MLNASLLRDRIGKATERWNNARAVDPEIKKAKVGTMKAVLENQTAKMPELADRKRKEEMTIAWVEANDNTAKNEANVTTRGFPCEFTGWTPNTKSQKVTIKRRFSETFLIPSENDLIDNLFTTQDLFNAGYAQAIQNISLKINEYFISKIIEFAGDNKFHEGFGQSALTGPTAWHKTKFPKKNMYDKEFPNVLNQYLSMAQKMNKLKNPYVIEGGLLQLTDNMRIDGSTDKYNYAGRTVYSDMENMISWGENESLFNDMFLIAQGALAFFSVYNNPTTPLEEGGSNFHHTRMARPLLGFNDSNNNPIMVDIKHERIKAELIPEKYPDLDVDNRCEIYDVYSLEVHGELFLNPKLINDTVTGIQHIVADPALDYFKTMNSVYYTETL